MEEILSDFKMTYPEKRWFKQISPEQPDKSKSRKLNFNTLELKVHDKLKSRKLLFVC